MRIASCPSLSFTRLPMQMLRRMRKWANTEVLADADSEDYSLIDDLRALIEAPTESTALPAASLSDPVVPTMASGAVPVVEPV